MGENIAANVPPTIGICAALCEYNSIIITLTIGIVILPYEHFGQHYDGNNDTIDEELEKMNYEKGKY